MDDPPDAWLTLTEAAARTGHTREAIRARIRRGSLPSSKGNDGQLRVQARDLADLPPPDAATDGHGQPDDVTTADHGRPPDPAMAVLLSTVAGLRTEVADLRTTLAATQADRLADHGRAERAEAQGKAEAARAAMAEARLAAAETALAEARTPWAVRVIRAWRRPGGQP